MLPGSVILFGSILYFVYFVIKGNFELIYHLINDFFSNSFAVF